MSVKFLEMNQSRAHNNPVPPAPHPKRKAVFVKHRFQARYISWVAAFVLLAVISIGVDFYFHFGREVQNFMDPSLYELFKSGTYIFIFKLILYMVAVILFAIIGSHRLAGPIYRFERSARVVGSGDLTHRVETRRGDDMAELRDEFNTMVDSLHRLVSTDANLAARVGKQVDEVLTNKHLPPDVAAKLNQIRAELDLLHKGFKI